MLGDKPVLLPMHAQSTLGFIKDVQAGTCFMRHETTSKKDDFELVELQFYNLKGSGLRAICINEFS